jgi:hypothetical protein
VIQFALASFPFFPLPRLSPKGINAMNNNPVELDQTDEDIFASDVSDDALEAAASTMFEPSVSEAGRCSTCPGACTRANC